MTSKAVPLSALLLSVTILSQAAVLVRFAHLPSETLGFWRVLLSSLICTLLIGLKVQFKQTSLATLKPMLSWRGFSAAFFFFVHFWTWFHAVQFTTIANATLFFCMNPLFVAIGASIFLREPFTVRLKIALALGLLGILVVEWGKVHFDAGLIKGDLLSLITSLCFSGYVLLAKDLRQRVGNFEMLWIINLVSFIGFGLLLIVGGVLEPGRAPNAHEFPTSTWLALFGLAIGPSLIGHGLFSYSLRFFSSGFAACFNLTQPLLAALAGWFFFQEKLSTQDILGFILISSSLFVLFIPLRRRTVNPQSTN